MGLYSITRKVSNVNYELKLPKGSRIHPIFHVSLLELTKGNPPLDKTNEVHLEHELEEYDVEKVLDKRVSNGVTEYLIKWLDWDSIHNIWELAENLNCLEKLEGFHWRYPGTLEETSS